MIVPVLQYILKVTFLEVSWYSVALEIIGLVIMVMVWKWKNGEKAPKTFPIAIDPFREFNELTLAQALGSSSKPIKESAYLYLKNLTDCQGENLFDLLKLSHPGSNPYAWTSVLTSISNMIDETRVQIQNFATNMHQETSQLMTSSLGNDKSDEAKIRSQLTAQCKNQEVYSRFRNLAFPVGTKVRLTDENTGATVSNTESLVKSLVEAPARIVQGVILKIKKHVSEYYTKIRLWIQKPDITEQCRNVFAEYKLLVLATQILTNVAEFSIVNDSDGVISTTLGKIIPMHVQFYEELEELIQALREIKSPLVQACPAELDLLVNLLKEYRKSLVFFHIHYSGHAEVLQIPKYIIKHWDRICGTELGHLKTKLSVTERQITLFPNEA